VTARPRRPLLAPWFRVVGDGERLLLEHAQSLVVLEGAAVRTLLPALIPLLDGTRTIDELAQTVGPAVRPAIECALDVLSARGVVVEGPDAPLRSRPGARAAAALFGIGLADASARLGSASVGLVGRSDVAVDVARLLAGAGLAAVRRLGWGGRGRADLTVVAPAPDELDRLPAWNRHALSAEVRWLYVRPFDGRCSAIGPLFVPGQTCCYECLLLRRGANSGFAADHADVEATPIAAHADAGITALAAAVAAHLALRWLVGRDRAAAGAVRTIELVPGLRLVEHAVLRVPRCPACSGLARLAAPLPWHPAAA
jgi:bacteriocin biosynthesis cyclodehydratase domain-containing protein